ncbi:RdgB/HAM1 family non-canonical purine NTP pyrophosphatase [Pseudochryseolinea flava]|uniref:dITP/XTP pyrophosphatase n=1 Tax=Pseudochryseolinea flava TaxID=2059302 RepID=A0A364YA80_9BACT|nr:RdgB/HAM1 family non-canonical purine NTP pyrophosphatase [Pseudochryseolinea flava]RAW02788.1 non-canonical purine NTP pyrophosphatase, RdgB/HAM1 family [Pseudochryseolinea flava]
MIEICFATNNKHKIEEVQAALGNQFRLISLDEINCKEELPETQDTLEGNALQKANYVFQNYATPCFADDTGLEVSALNNAPGVYSARYAGPQRNSDDNIELLLSNLLAHKNRSAQFRTVIALVGLTPDPSLFEGVVKGIITPERHGSHGFGYDPVFMPEGRQHTFAQMDLVQKNTLSHRGLAVKKLASFLKNYKP